MYCLGQRGSRHAGGLARGCPHSCAAAKMLPQGRAHCVLPCGCSCTGRFLGSKWQTCPVRAQFRALSDQLYGTGSHYAWLRQLAVEQQAACPQWCAQTFFICPHTYESFHTAAHALVAPIEASGSLYVGAGAAGGWRRTRTESPGLDWGPVADAGVSCAGRQGHALVGLSKRRMLSKRQSSAEGASCSLYALVHASRVRAQQHLSVNLGTLLRAPTPCKARAGPRGPA